MCYGGEGRERPEEALLLCGALSYPVSASSDLLPSQKLEGYMERTDALAVSGSTLFCSGLVGIT